MWIDVKLMTVAESRIFVKGSTRIPFFFKKFEFYNNELSVFLIL